MPDPAEPQGTLHIDRDERSIYVFTDRNNNSGADAARLTARLQSVLSDFSQFRFMPAHDADVFGWTVEFERTDQAILCVTALAAAEWSRSLE